MCLHFFQRFVFVVTTTKLGRFAVFIVIIEHIVEHISYLVLVLLQCFTLSRIEQVAVYWVKRHCLRCIYFLIFLFFRFCILT